MRLLPDKSKYNANIYKVMNLKRFILKKSFLKQKIKQDGLYNTVTYRHITQFN